ncbi:hypothetical protein GQR58_030341 [Nymphon striatum]|nr:hypothetical protein GQR58_030341 [Nymphon striatum]
MALLLATALLLTGVVVGTSPAQAQADSYETCAEYSLIVGAGGQVAADAAARLQALGAPNPFGVDNVLEVIINSEADVPPIGSRPTASALEVAYVELDNYFGGVCADIDICPLIRQAVATNDGSSAEAARLARGLSFPSPPGIDAALAFIAGEISESPLHNSIAEAQDQISSYFPCEAAPADTPIPVPGVPSDVAGTCGDLNVLSIPEGPFAIEAAESLRARGAPNPPGIEAALDVIVAAADFSSPTPPPLDQIDAALATLGSYYGGVCDNIDRCAFVNQIAGSDDAAAAEAARLLRRIETPSPPGIDASLALIAGDIDESPFHANVAEARQQILDYYPCGASTDDATTDDDGRPVLAFTGSSATAALSALGAGLLASGAGLLHSRRRLLAGERQHAAVGDQFAGRVGLFLTVDDFDVQYERMVAGGVEFTTEPRDESYGRIAVWRDIAGNLWDLLGPA